MNTNLTQGFKTFGTTLQDSFAAGFTELAGAMRSVQHPAAVELPSPPEAGMASAVSNSEDYVPYDATATAAAARLRPGKQMSTSILWRSSNWRAHAWRAPSKSTQLRQLSTPLPCPLLPFVLGGLSLASLLNRGARCPRTRLRPPTSGTRMRGL